jgi:hypothetical protein
VLDTGPRIGETYACNRTTVVTDTIFTDGFR